MHSSQQQLSRNLGLQSVLIRHPLVARTQPESGEQANGEPTSGENPSEPSYLAIVVGLKRLGQRRAREEDVLSPGSSVP